MFTLSILTVGTLLIILDSICNNTYGCYCFIYFDVLPHYLNGYRPRTPMGSEILSLYITWIYFTNASSIRRQTFQRKKIPKFYRATKGLPLIIWETKNNGKKTLRILKEHWPNENLKYYILYSLFAEINSYWQCDKRWKFYLLFKNTGRNNQWNHGFKNTSVRMQTFYHHHHSKRNIEFKVVLRR